MRPQADEEERIAASDKTKTIVSRVADRVHGMRGHFEYTIEDEGSVKRAAGNETTTLKEHVAPVPAVVFHDVVGFSLDPEVERDQGEADDPATTRLVRARRR